MTNDNKPPMFGPSGVFDPATYEPRSGKTFWMAATDVSSLANKRVEAETFIGDCTTNIPFKFEFDPKDNGHYLIFGSTRLGMSGMVARPSLLPWHFMPPERPGRIQTDGKGHRVAPEGQRNESAAQGG